jgi:hypothetical protein
MQLFIACNFYWHLFFPFEIYGIIARYVKTAILSALLIWLKEYLFLWRSPITKCLNSVSLVFNSKGNFWLIFILHHNDKLSLFINFAHHPWLALKGILLFASHFFAFYIKASLVTGNSLRQVLDVFETELVALQSVSSFLIWTAASKMWLCPRE